MILKIFLLIFSVIYIHIINAQFEWQIKDAFDEIEAKMQLVSPRNCETKQLSELTLHATSLPQIPSVKKIDPIYKNRTMLRHLHDVALNRGFFYSFIFARANDSYEPGLMYMFMSQIADIAGNYYVNGSGIIFDSNTSYPNYYRDFFNKTLDYFAPYAYRQDDFLDISNPFRLATLSTFAAKDLGAKAGPKYNQDEFWKVNEWFKLWLPDDTRDLSKTEYHIIMKYSNKTGHISSVSNFAFFGPPGPAENPGPVKWTLPYFDCRRSNKWIVSVATPVVDYFPRHTIWKHLRKHKYVAVSTADIDFNRIDINPCPKMRGNEEPNLFAGIARCKNTTVCEPLHGYGFRRGGYHCVCKPGHRLPHWQRGPYLGEHVEKATKMEYQSGFDCVEIQRIEFFPAPDTSSDPSAFYGEESNSMYERSVGSDDRSGRRHPPPLPTPLSVGKELSDSIGSPDNTEGDHLVRPKRSSYASNTRLGSIFRSLKQVNKDNCDGLQENKLKLPGDVINDAPASFEMQARVAQRTANFLSYYLQQVDPSELFTDRLTDQFLTVDQLYGEVLANVMGGYKIVGSGIFFDMNSFLTRDGLTRSLFGPYAHRTGDDLTFHVVDKAGLPGKPYTDSLPYFRRAKEKFGTSTIDRLSRFTSYILMRADKRGERLTKYENYPDHYWAATEGDGDWYGPYFNCHGEVQSWLLTYWIPFFGRDDLRKSYVFKGIVTVDVELAEMDINQCPNDHSVPSAYKNTDRCHYDSQYCVFLPGKGFKTGGYKCECNQGYEYPYNLPKTYFEGDELESEFGKMSRNRSNRYDLFRCRIAGSPSTIPLTKSHNHFVKIIFIFTILLCYLN